MKRSTLRKFFTQHSARTREVRETKLPAPQVHDVHTHIDTTSAVCVCGQTAVALETRTSALGRLYITSRCGGCRGKVVA